jgi:hypothetical protein
MALACLFAHLGARSQAKSSRESGIHLDRRHVLLLRAPSDPISSDDWRGPRVRLHTSPSHKHGLCGRGLQLPVGSDRLRLTVLQLHHDILRNGIRVEQEADQRSWQVDKTALQAGEQCQFDRRGRRRDGPSACHGHVKHNLVGESGRCRE